MAEDGEIVRLLPGWYSAPDPPWTALVLAAARWDPDAVICGAASAALTFWPTIDVRPVEVASGRCRARAAGYRFSQRRVPPDLVAQRGEIRLTTPALTAVDLAGTPVGGEAIDQVLRARAATLDQLHAALADTAGRRGNRARSAVLLDSRDEPWSAAERLTHRILRQAGVTGWTANAEVRLRSGEQVRRYFIDVCFRAARLAVEIDGRLHHDTSSAFEADRLRQNDLQLAGWRVLRFTWDMVVRCPDYVVATIRAALR